MHGKHVFLILLSLLFVHSASAEEWSFKLGERSEYVTLSREDDFWEMSWYEARPTELQVRRQHLTSRSESVVRSETKKLLSRLHYREENLPVRAAPVASSPSGTQPRFTTEVPGEVIWDATENWSWQWEEKFSNWVRDEIGTDFFSRYGLATDCKAVAVLSRWIFARINGLPAGNTLAGSNRLFTQASMRKDWLKLSKGGEWYKDRRFMAALAYLTTNTYTGSILWDGYPIAINSTSLIPGVFHLEFHPGGSGHTMVVSRVTEGNWGVPQAMTMIQSTLPIEVRELMTTDYVHAQQPSRSGGGFLRMRWPIRAANGDWSFLDENKHPNYSLEEYSSNFMNGSKSFSVAIKLHLFSHYDSFSDSMNAISLLRDSLRARVPLVEDGFAECHAQTCKRGSALWDQYSTPSRDSQILDLIEMIQDTLHLPGVDGRATNAWNQFLSETLAIDGQQRPMKILVQSFIDQRETSNPADAIVKRWGLL